MKVFASAIILLVMLSSSATSWSAAAPAGNTWGASATSFFERVRSTTIFQIKKAIAEKYFDIYKKPKINVFVESAEGDISGEPIVKEYLDHVLADSIEASSQFNRVAAIDDKADCFIQLFLKQPDINTARISHRVIDSKTLRIISEGDNSYALTYDDDQEFAEFLVNKQAEIARNEKIGDTRLVMMAHTNGESFKASDNYYLLLLKSKASANLLLLKETTGHSGYYPSLIEVQLDGEVYKPNSERVVFDGEILPKRYKVTASFQECTWDAKIKSELRGKTHQKSFFVDITKDDQIFIDLLFEYDGRKGGITVKGKAINERKDPDGRHPTEKQVVFDYI